MSTFLTQLGLVVKFKIFMGPIKKINKDSLAEGWGINLTLNHKTFSRAGLIILALNTGSCRYTKKRWLKE